MVSKKDEGVYIQLYRVGNHIWVIKLVQQTKQNYKELITIKFRIAISYWQQERL